jgi:hypothetical protein
LVSSSLPTCLPGSARLPSPGVTANIHYSTAFEELVDAIEPTNRPGRGRSCKRLGKLRTDKGHNAACSIEVHSLKGFLRFPVLGRHLVGPVGETPQLVVAEEYRVGRREAEEEFDG